MVNVVMKTHPISGRQLLQETDFDESRRVVRVVPKNADIRKYLKHPKNRVGFLAEGSAEWPNDTFTKRRIIDGDVTIEPAAVQQARQQKAIEQQSGGKAATEQKQPEKAEKAEAPKSE